MQLGVITVFPEMFQTLQYGVMGRAIKQNLLHITYWNPRDYAANKNKNIDDRPYGGGPGMVMTMQPLRDTIRIAKAKLPNARVIYLTPQGKRLDQAGVIALANYSQLVLVSGRYEGIDERLIATQIDEEWSIGDYILSGGELAAMVMMDAIARLIPGVLGHEGSAQQDSFMKGLLDHPHYTRPEQSDGLAVPDVLVNGNHAEIKRWRLKQALGRTWLRRPDLLEKRALTPEEQVLLTEFITENRGH